MKILIDGQTLRTPEINRGIGKYFLNVVENILNVDFTNDFFLVAPNGSKLDVFAPWTREKLHVIDVREPHEFDICDIGGELIPMGDIPSNVDKVSKDKQVIIHCRSGKRSGDTISWLEKNHNFQNLYNLKGGILAWAREIDPEMPTY